VILYECLSGSVPFQSETFFGVLQQHFFEEPPPIERDDGPCALEPVMARCLQKDPDARYQTMGEVVAAIEGTVGVDESKRGNEHRSRRRRDDEAGDSGRGWLLAGLILVAAGAVGFLAVRHLSSGSTTAASPTPSVAGTARGEAGATASVVATAPAPAPAPMPSSSPTGEATATATSPVPAVQPPPPVALPLPPPPPDPAPPPAPAAGSQGDVVDPWD
jgi:serine/threonine-protein kinase